MDVFHLLRVGGANLAGLYLLIHLADPVGKIVCGGVIALIWQFVIILQIMNLTLMTDIFIDIGYLNLGPNLISFQNLGLIRILNLILIGRIVILLVHLQLVYETATIIIVRITICLVVIL